MPLIVSCVAAGRTSLETRACAAGPQRLVVRPARGRVPVDVAAHDTDVAAGRGANAQNRGRGHEPDGSLAVPGRERLLVPVDYLDAHRRIHLLEPRLQEAGPERLEVRRVGEHSAVPGRHNEVSRAVHEHGERVVRDRPVERVRDRHLRLRREVLRYADHLDGRREIHADGHARVRGAHEERLGCRAAAHQRFPSVRERGPDRTFREQVRVDPSEDRNAATVQREAERRRAVAGVREHPRRAVRAVRERDQRRRRGAQRVRHHRVPHGLGPALGEQDVVQDHDVADPVRDQLLERVLPAQHDLREHEVARATAAARAVGDAAAHDELRAPHRARADDRDARGQQFGVCVHFDVAEQRATRRGRRRIRDKHLAGEVEHERADRCELAAGVAAHRDLLEELEVSDGGAARRRGARLGDDETGGAHARKAAQAGRRKQRGRREKELHGCQHLRLEGEGERRAVKNESRSRMMSTVAGHACPPTGFSLSSPHIVAGWVQYCLYLLMSRASTLGLGLQRGTRDETERLKLNESNKDGHT
ncbi:hypothetical protein PybrP1_006257 [[Pythium] brassicae (nom. inval.)]|nr:hypothetical protein PybrP1_006257 [[Pythium] brassicae (nom. inval.)]